ncbi:variable surface protein [Plasmodium gonderi]|uniref:Variable surface protein n=1 Tax=Plasmodium gonderi TaxID=77519 RepID=A0A1Y1JKP4_PLAGO|nr:variable surface protein [Plasmodium gonderi]GAW82025.1 variable surface protein [Plasmodium gonderi]
MEEDVVCLNYYNFKLLSSHFPEYKKFMEGDVIENYATHNSISNEIKNKRQNLKYFKVIENICDKLVAYLFKIHDELGNASRIKEGLIYLYYWMYKNYQKTGKDSNYIKEIYNELIKEYYETGIGKLFKPTPDINIFDELWIKPEDISDWFTKFKDIEKCTLMSLSEEHTCKCVHECYRTYIEKINTCKNYVKPNSCNILENIRTLYSNINKIIDKCINVNCKKSPINNEFNSLSPPPRTNMAALIIIPTLIILIIPLLSSILYKFIPYNSCLRYGIKKIINMWNNAKNVWIFMETSEKFNNISWNTKYNVLYNSISS